MISNQKTKVFVFLFLAFCVLSSKNIIIYNEETLVALSFLAFVFFCFKYFGDTIKESLNERSDSIKLELQNFLNLKQQALIHLKEEHQRIYNLKHILPILGGFTEKQLSIRSEYGGNDLKQIFCNQITHKLLVLGSSKNKLQQDLQQLIAKNMQALVLIKLQRINKNTKTNNNQQKLDPLTLQNSIELLKSSK